MVMPLNGSRHVETLSDDELNVLIDRHLFGHTEWCRGEADVFYPTTAPAEYRCRLCAAVFEPTLAQRIFGAGEHRRVPPRHGIEQITARMREMPYQTQLRYALATRVALTSNGLHRSITVEFLHLLMLLSPRLLAVAALNAIGKVDAQGFLEHG